MRGMNGDRAAPSGGKRTVTVDASLGDETVYDENQYAGSIGEQTVYNGRTTRPVSKSVYVPWRSSAKATRTINGDTADARFVKTRVTYVGTALGVDGSRGWRTTRSTSSFDDGDGTTKWEQDDGDVAKSDDEQCTTYTYNNNTAKNLVGVVQRVVTSPLTCDKQITDVADVMSDAR
jgi:hypothetical protein